MTFMDLVKYNGSVDTAFSTVGGLSLSSLLKLVITTEIFLFFPLYFSTIICKSSLLVLLPLKSRKYNMKFRQIKSNIICIKLTVANSFIGNFYFFIATTFFQILCVFSDQILDCLQEERLLHRIQLFYSVKQQSHN